jgi:hypothetical protein
VLCFHRYRQSLIFSSASIGAFLPVLATHNIRNASNDVTHAIIAIHGLNENALKTFLDASSALGNRTDTVVIVPWFHALSVPGTSWDPQCGSSSSIFWPVNSTSWLAGGDCDHTAKDGTHYRATSSFAVLDELYHELQNPVLFPSLRSVTYVGFSAGGQMVNRYAWASDVGGKFSDHALAGDTDGESTLDADLVESLSARRDPALSVRFVVADASSYLYFDQLRPSPSCNDMNDTGPEHTCKSFTAYTMIEPYAGARTSYSGSGIKATVGSEWDYESPRLALTSCRTFNEWKYGTKFPPRMRAEGYSYLQRFIDNPTLVRRHTEMYR